MRTIIFTIVAALSVISLKAQEKAVDMLPAVSLITVGPGDDAYQLEGHTALRLQFPDGRDLAVNWGVFDFNAPNFAYRFVKGETDYSIGICPYKLMLSEYGDTRNITEQYLNLTPAETSKLVELINENLLPANRVYRYNYVLDNCATRPLAIIERALAADSATLRTDMPETETTFRKEMRYYHRNFPAYQMFIDYALGSGLDRPISTRERAYAPIFLEELAANSVIVDKDGTTRPLTGKALTVVGGPAEPYTERGIPPWVVVTGVLIVTIAMTWRDQRRKKVTQWFDAIFYAILGVLGAVLTFLIFVSIHEATSPNINYLWLNPLCFTVTIFAGFKRCKKIVFFYQIANFAAIAVFLIGIPFFNQSVNLLFLPLIASDLIRSLNYIIINRR